MMTEDTHSPEPAPDSAQPEATPATVRRRGPLSLAAGVLLSPRATFAYLRDHGDRSWLWPLLLAVALTVASRAVAIPIQQAQAALEAIREQMGGQVVGGTSGMVMGAPAFTTGGPGLPAGSPLADYGWAVTGLLGRWLLAGLAVFGLAWLMGGRPGLGSTLRMAAWATVPLSLGLLVGLGVMLATGRLPSTGLSPSTGGQSVAVNTQVGVSGGQVGGATPAVRMAGPGAVVGAGPSLGALVRGSFMRDLSLYSLWFLLVLGIGAAVTARIGPVRAGLATLGYWGLSLVLASLPPLLTFWLFALGGAGGLRTLP